MRVTSATEWIQNFPGFSKINKNLIKVAYFIERKEGRK